VLDFLLIEHMNHAGKENGNLKATYEQLEQFGVRKNSIGDALAELYDVGLVDTVKGPRQVATRYELTFFSARAAEPTNRWRFYRGQPMRRLTPPTKLYNPTTKIDIPPPEKGGDIPPETGGVDPSLTPRNGGCGSPPEMGGPSISGQGMHMRAGPPAPGAWCRDAADVELALRVGVAWFGAVQQAVALDVEATE
jgi:hypothetical protein